jgi:hypothetical protein
VHFLTTQKLPAFEARPAIHQLLYFLWRPCAKARDVAVEDQAKGYQRHDVGEKQVRWGPPEDHRRVQERQRTKEETGKEAAEGARL